MRADEKFRGFRREYDWKGLPSEVFWDDETIF